MDEFGSADLRGRGINGIRTAGGVWDSARGVLADAAAAEARGGEAGAFGRAQPVTAAENSGRRVVGLAGLTLLMDLC